MKKEIAMMFKYNVFEVKPRGYKFKTEEGWQFAPLHWVFAVKHDGRHKARLVMGGHVTEAENKDRYASTVRLEHIRLQIFLLALNKCEIVGGDIGSAYLNAFTKEKIWSILGLEFGEKMRDKVVKIIEALYGLKTSANA